MYLPHALLLQSPPTASISSFGFLLGSVSSLLFCRKPSHDFLPTPFLQGFLSSPFAPLLSRPVPCCCSDLPNRFLETRKALRYLWLKKMSPKLGTGESHESIPVTGLSGIDAAAYIFHKILTIACTWKQDPRLNEPVVNSFCSRDDEHNNFHTQLTLCPEQSNPS